MKEKFHQILLDDSNIDNRIGVEIAREAFTSTVHCNYLCNSVTTVLRRSIPLCVSTVLWQKCESGIVVFVPIIVALAQGRTSFPPSWTKHHLTPWYALLESELNAVRPGVQARVCAFVYIVYIRHNRLHNIRLQFCVSCQLTRFVMVSTFGSQIHR